MDRVLIRRALMAGAALTLASMALPTAALAQSAAADSAVGDIVVTAQKREQNLIDVPITITAYTGAFLQKLDVRDFHDLSQFTPGFYVQNQSPNDSGFVMRGITTDSGAITDEARVSIYQDGVDISRSRGSYIELFDLQRVEVDKGPQSTLYGRSALVGAVDVIQNKASERGFDWNARVEAGDYNDAAVEGMVNIPIDDTLALRFSGRYRRRDGYIDNLSGGDAFNSVDTGAFRAALNWRPNNRLNTDFIFNYESDQPSGTSFKNATFYPTNPATGQVLGNLSPYTGAALSAAPDFPLGNKLGIDRHVWGATELVDYKISDTLKLSSITAFRHFDALEIFDPDGFSYPAVTAAEDTYANQVSQEFRLNYDDGHRFNGFIGVNGFGEQGKYHIVTEVDERAALALKAGTLDRTNPNPTALSTIDSPVTTAETLLGLFGLPQSLAPLAETVADNLKTNHMEQYTQGARTAEGDIYADGTYRITDKLQVSAGIRNSYEYKTTSLAASNLNGASALGALLNNPLGTFSDLITPGAPNLPNYGAQTNPTAGNGDVVRRHLSNDGFSWRLNALYKFDPDTSVYLTYARGRRPEVLAVQGPPTPGAAPLFTKAPAETVDDVEGGVKAALFGRRLRIDASLFYYSYTNFQTDQIVGNQIVTTNAGSAEDYGFEGQASYKVDALLDLFGTYTYTHARFDSGLYKGNHFRLTPDHMLSLGADAHMAALGGVVEFIPTFVYRSKAYFDDDNANPALLTGALITPLVFNEYQNGYGLLDLRFAYHPLHGNWRLEAFVTNATDTHYLKDAGNTGEDFGLPTYIAGEPRMFGFAFSIRR